MLNIVVIEDNDNLRGSIARALSQAGHNVSDVESAEAFVEQKEMAFPDLLLIDLNLPGEDGLSLTSRMRMLQPGVGIIVLTGRNGALDKQSGYESGADIYLTKPITPEELTAAVHALERRLTPRPGNFDITIDPVLNSLHGPAGRVRLSGNELGVLIGLSRAQGRKLETWQIAELIGDEEMLPERNSLNVTIFRINNKLKQVGSGVRGIHAIRNWGYQLVIGIGVQPATTNPN